MLLFWLKEVDILWAPVRENRVTDEAIIQNVRLLGWEKQRCIFPAERNHVGIGAVEKNMLPILDTINVTQVTGGEVTLIHATVSKRRV